MFHCERCGSRFHSKRAATIRNCPRCLLRNDVASPLVFDPPEPSVPAGGGETVSRSTPTKELEPKRTQE